MPNAIPPFAIWQTAYIIFFKRKLALKKSRTKLALKIPAKNAAK